jgi:predicted transcriptional regulator
MVEKSIYESLIAEGFSVSEIAKELSLGKTTVRYWLNKYGLKTSWSGGKRKIKKHKCYSCGEDNPKNFYSKQKISCKKCHNKQRSVDQRNVKKLAVDYKGGSCITCGYSKSLSALEFHHRDPNEKDLPPSKLNNHKFEDIKVELDKCDLLCANCHREEHDRLRLI